MKFTRRQTLQGLSWGVTGLGIGGVVPEFLRTAAAAAPEGERVLVVVQLTGGNDGLNTVIPYRHEVYQRARPELRIPGSDVLPLAGATAPLELGWHPALRGFASLYDAGQLSIVQGVGYPEPNRSHFESMDIWHTCQRKGERNREGWLGKYFSHLKQEAGSGAWGLHLGTEKQPLALAARDVAVPTIQRLEQFRLQLDRVETRVALQRGSVPSGSSELLDFVQTTQQSALSVSDRLTTKAGKAALRPGYPETPLANKLSTAAELILSGLETRVYYVELDGFDTHAQQLSAHAALLKQLGDAVAAFVGDLQQAGALDRVAVLCFSEFGRRVAENASAGTDHGTAAPVFLAGGGIRAGLWGEHPSLEDLDAGDLRFRIDFRAVYAAILQQWLGVAPELVLAGNYPPLQLFT